MKLARVEERLVSPFMEVAVLVWRGDGFVVGLYTFQNIHRLTIQREDASPEPMSWETLQAIKSACGYGHVDAVEVYPRDCDVVNTANLRHLYLFDAPLAFKMHGKPPTLQTSNPGEKRS